MPSNLRFHQTEIISHIYVILNEIKQQKERCERRMEEIKKDCEGHYSNNDEYKELFTKKTRYIDLANRLIQAYRAVEGIELSVLVEKERPKF